MPFLAIATASFVGALFFLRFWTSTRNKLFLYFALSYLIEATNRLVLEELMQTNTATENHFVHLLRLASDSLILAGIWAKSRSARSNHV